MVDVGDSLVVFFTLKYVGKESITFDRVFVAAETPNGYEEFEEKSFRGKVLNSGESIRFHREIEVNKEGKWCLWPSFVYRIGSKTIGPIDRWHECCVEVKEKVVTTTPPPEPNPDLIITYIRWERGSVENWEWTQRNWSFYYTIKNVGDAPAGSSISELTIDGVHIAYDEVDPLNPGEERTEVISGVDWQCLGDTDRIRVIADYNNQISEKSPYGETNNERMVSARCEQYVTKGVDLVLKRIWLEEVSEEMDIPGEASRVFTKKVIFFEVKNTGADDSGQFHVKLYVDGQEVDCIKIDSLRAGETTHTYFSNYNFDVACTGLNDTIRVVVDPWRYDEVVEGGDIGSGEVRERINDNINVDDRNNEITEVFECLPRPDLVIEDIWEENGRIKYEIKNAGPADAGESVTYLSLARPGVFHEELYDTVGPLAAGETRVEEFEGYTFQCDPSIGIYQAYVEADVNNDVTEVDENNNFNTTAFYCIRNYPDLIIEDVWVEGFTIKYRIKNHASVGAGKSSTRLEAIGHGYRCYDEIDELGAGESRIEAFENCPPIPCWFQVKLNVTLTADAYDDVGEYNEVNNEFTKEIENPCANGVQDPGEEGIDCGGPCPAKCLDCFADAEPGKAEDAGYFKLKSPVVQQYALYALQEYANCLRDDSCRSTLIKYDDSLDFSTVTVDVLESRPDYIMEAVAYYVDQHTTYMYDDGCNMCDHDGVINAEDMILRSGGRSGKLSGGVHVDHCPNDFCGDCEDHAVLREALMRVLGISWRCAYCADHYNSYWGGGHTFNLVYYKGKWRIMDYGVLGSYFSVSSRSDQHDPDNAWNDHVGEYWCPDSIDDPACSLCCNHGAPDNYEGGKSCPGYYEEWAP